MHGILALVSYHNHPIEGLGSLLKSFLSPCVMRAERKRNGSVHVTLVLMFNTALPRLVKIVTVSTRLMSAAHLSIRMSVHMVTSRDKANVKVTR